MMVFVVIICLATKPVCNLENNLEVRKSLPLLPKECVIHFNEVMKAAKQPAGFRVVVGCEPHNGA